MPFDDIQVARRALEDCRLSSAITDSLSLRQIAEFAQGSLTARDEGLTVLRVSTDSNTPIRRSCRRRGENFDGQNLSSKPASAAPWARWSKRVGRARRRFPARFGFPNTLAGYQKLAVNHPDIAAAKGNRHHGQQR